MDKITAKIRTLRREQEKLQTLAEKTEKLWKQAERDRQRTGLEYAEKEQQAKLQLQSACQLLTHLKSTVDEVFQTPLNPNPESLEKMNQEAYRLEDHLIRISTATDHLFPPKNSPLDTYHQLSQKTDEVRIKLQGLIEKERSYRDQHCFLEAQAQSKGHEISQLQNSLARGRAESPGVLALVDDFIEDQLSAIDMGE